MRKDLRQAIDIVAEFVSNEAPRCTDAFEMVSGIDEAVQQLECCQIDEPKMRVALRDMAVKVLEALEEG